MRVLLTSAIVAVSAVLSSSSTALSQRPDGTIGPARSASLPADTNVIAIIPFSVSGPAGNEHLGESVMDLLQMALDGRAGIRVLNPTQVLNTLGDGRAGLTPLKAVPAMRPLGVGRIVGGTVVVSGTELRIRVDVFDLVRATPRFSVSASGTTSNLARVIDTTATRILARRLVPNRLLQARGVSEYSSASADALTAYLIAEQAIRRRDRKRAADSLLSALRLDPDFGLAHVRIIRNEGSLVGVTGLGPAGASQLLKNAIERRQRFSPRIRSILEAMDAGQAGDRVGALSRWDQLVRSYPNDSEVLYQRADRYFHSGLNLGAPLDSVIRMFVGALAVEYDDPELVDHLVGLYLERGDTTAALKINRGCPALGNGCLRASIDVKYHGARPWAVPPSQLVPAALPTLFELRHLREDLPRGVAIVDSSEMARASLQADNPDQLAIIYIRRAWIGYLNGRFEHAGILLDSARRIGQQQGNLYAAHLRLISILSGRRVEEAARTLSSPPPMNPERRLTRAWFAVERLPADSAARYIGELTGGDRADSALYVSAVAGLRGLLALSAGDTARARAQLATALRHAGRRVGPERMFFPANAFVYQYAAIQFAQRDYLGARRTLADLYPPFDALPYVAPGEELKGKVYLALGDTASARIALKNFVGLWDKADPQFQPRVAAARELLARIGER